jgi:hypothetical protein
MELQTTIFLIFTGVIKNMRVLLEGPEKRSRGLKAEKAGGTRPVSRE